MWQLLQKKVEFNTFLHYPTINFAFAHQPIAPLTHTLKLGQEIEFQYKIPGAVKAAVIINNQFYHLTNTNQLFRGKVLMKGAKVVHVAAMFEENTNVYVQIAEYIIS